MKLYFLVGCDEVISSCGMWWSYIFLWDVMKLYFLVRCDEVIFSCGMWWSYFFLWDVMKLFLVGCNELISSCGMWWTYFFLWDVIKVFFLWDVVKLLIGNVFWLLAHHLELFVNGSSVAQKSNVSPKTWVRCFMF